MPLKELGPLSASELKVMKIVWDFEECSARDVYRITQDQYRWHPGTTRTLLHRLVKKGYLKTQQIGNSYLYKPLSDRTETLCKEANKLLEGNSRSVTASLMFHMVKQGNLTQSDIQELRLRLDEYEKNNQ